MSNYTQIDIDWKMFREAIDYGISCGIANAIPTKRELFAVAAMISLHCSDSRGGVWDSRSAEMCAKNAVIQADALIAQLAKEPKP